MAFINLVMAILFTHYHFETGSRQIIDLNGAATGGGQYNTMSNWLTNLASSPVYASNGDVGRVRQ